MSAPIESLLIIGGGPAGWMAALYLNRFLGPGACRIQVLDPPAPAPAANAIGSLPRLLGFIRNLRLDEAALLRASNATFKLAIRFVDWHRPAQAYWHPFGVCGGSIDGVELFHPWLRAAQAGAEPAPYDGFSLQAQAAAAGLAPGPLRGTSPILDAGAYAWHLDPSAFAAHLRELATAEGVLRSADAVACIEQGADGAVAAVCTASGQRLCADLYLDCTDAPAGSPCADALAGDSWHDWSELLLYDRELTLSLPPAADPPSHTEARALAAGWRWQIPLRRRTDIGYVYSSRHQDPAAAWASLRASLPTPSTDLEWHERRLRLGRRGACWQHNLVAIGAAAGRLGPLEATELFFVQLGIEALMEHFPDRRAEPILRQDYNRLMAQAFDETRDFLLLHFLLGERADTAFWRDARAVAVPPSLLEAMARYQATGAVLAPGSPFASTSYHFLYSGNARLPRRPSPQVARIDPVQATAIMRRMLAANRTTLAGLPSHGALLAAIDGTA